MRNGSLCEGYVDVVPEDDVLVHVSGRGAHPQRVKGDEVVRHGARVLCWFAGAGRGRSCPYLDWFGRRAYLEYFCLCEGIIKQSPSDLSRTLHSPPPSTATEERRVVSAAQRVGSGMLSSMLPPHGGGEGERARWAGARRTRRRYYMPCMWQREGEHAAARRMRPVCGGRGLHVWSGAGRGECGARGGGGVWLGATRLSAT